MRDKISFIENSNRYKYLWNIPTFLYLFMNAYIRLVDNSQYALSLCLLSLISAGIIGTLKLLYHNKSSIVIYMVFLCVSWFFSFFTRSGWRYDIKLFIYSVSYIGIAYSLLSNRHCLYPYAGLYYLVSAYILFKICVLKFPIRGFMLDDSSYNFISVITLFYLGILCLVQIQNGKKISYIQAGIYLIICFIAYGRSGILSGLGLFFLITVIRCMRYRKKAIFFVSTGILFFLLILNGKNIFHQIISSGYFEKFLLKGFQTERGMIWKTFLTGNLDNITSFLLGSDPTVLMPDGNLHNSFLQMYVSFGLVFFIINTYLIIKSSIFHLKNKNIWLLVVISVVFFRAFADKLFFRGYCEIIYYYFIFSFLEERPLRRYYK